MYHLLYTPTFMSWWERLNPEDQAAVAGALKALEAIGPEFGVPHVHRVRQSYFDTMRELRVDCGHRNVRVLFGFDRSSQIRVAHRRG